MLFKLQCNHALSLSLSLFLGRTYPSHPFFSSQFGHGRTALYNILHAYAVADKEVGYCQGLSFVAGLIILHVSYMYCIKWLIIYYYTTCTSISCYILFIHFALCLSTPLCIVTNMYLFTIYLTMYVSISVCWRIRGIWTTQSLHVFVWI